MVSPLDMRMEMHTLGLVYGVSENLTLMVMIPYLSKSMNLINRRGTKFKTQSSGVGDVKLVGLYKLHGSDHGSNRRERHRLSLNAGVSLPTGDTDERDSVPTTRRHPEHQKTAVLDAIGFRNG